MAKQPDDQPKQDPDEDAMAALDSWVRKYLTNSRYSQDTRRYNSIMGHVAEIKSFLA